MRRVPACALWILLTSCSASGGGGTKIDVDTPSGGSSPTPVISPGAGGAAANVPGTGGAGNIFDQDGCTNGCAFGVDPILDADVSAQEITAFDAAGTFQPGSVCVLEPQLSTA